MRFSHDERQAVFSFSDKVVGEDHASKVADEVEAFVKAHRLPMLITFDEDMAPELFNDGREVIFLFRGGFHDPGNEKGRLADAGGRRGR